MVTVPDTLRSLFSAQVHEQDGRCTIDIPASKIDHGVLEPEATYRLVILDSVATDTDADPAAPDATQPASGEQLQGPPERRVR